MFPPPPESPTISELSSQITTFLICAAIAQYLLHTNFEMIFIFVNSLIDQQRLIILCLG